MNLDAEAYEDLLIKLGACNFSTSRRLGALDWSRGKDLRTAWETCDQANWMLWLAGRVMDHESVVAAACDCAELALMYVPAGEDRPRQCIEVTRKWCRGEATLDEVWIAKNIAKNAAFYAAADAAVAAAVAAAAAAAAAADVANADDAADLGFQAVFCAADAAFYTDGKEARNDMWAKCCEAIRKAITVDMLVSALNGGAK